ncbi:MAG: YceI family protein [Solirubrobacterales bacterium]|nr:YceI family protein [Solirubrobacterales bacterium]MBV9942840.1 YceI family protein [Solirubrobacterales bacterium]
MSATATATGTTGLPLGTWTLDPTHSSASFAVKHMGVATFRGRFEKLDATLTVEESSAELVGTVDASSIVVKDENLQGHLGSPDFFDVERYPQITFRSTSLRREGDQVIVDGELTIKGNTRALAARGEIAGPAVTLGDVTKVGLTLETIVDRTEFGLNWNAPLPKGGFAVANDVKLTVELELVQA